VWDIAAGALLVVEAGGSVRSMGSDPLLPLTASRDYADAVLPTAAAGTDAFADEALTATGRGRAGRTGAPRPQA
jgi:3'-phosphoadenosine 5'-phosphosulfate (PAPS) 3'-phosphatase